MKISRGLINYLLIVLGIVVGLTGIHGHLDNMQDNMPGTDAIITDVGSYSVYEGSKLRERMNVTVRYKVNGRNYDGYLGVYEEGMRAGNIIRIKYDPNNPEKILYRSTGGSATLLLATIGTVLIAAGICRILFVKMRFQGRFQIMRGTVLEVVRVLETDGRGGDGYVIMALVKDHETGERCEVRSRHYPYDIGEYVKKGDKVNVHKENGRWIMEDIKGGFYGSH